MTISAELAAKIAANLQAQHKLIAELREMTSPTTSYHIDDLGSVESVVWEFAYGEAAAYEDELLYSRAQVAQAILDGKTKL
jgi:hypothetical protein